MREKLIAKVSNETGIKVALVGFLVALAGVTLAFTLFPRLGYWLGVLGVLMGMLGAVLHFAKNWREIFFVDKK